MTSGGIANLGTTTIRNGFTKGPGDGGAAGSGDDVGTMQWHFVGGSAVFTMDGVKMEGELVRPNMGIDVGGGAIYVSVEMWGGCTVNVVETVEGCNIPMRLEAGEPNNATSSCCTVSKCKRSATWWM